MDPAQIEQDEFDATVGKAIADAPPEKLEAFVAALMSLPPVGMQKAPGSEEPGASGPKV